MKPSPGLHLSLIYQVQFILGRLHSEPRVPDPSPHCHHYSHAARPQVQRRHHGRMPTGCLQHNVWRCAPYLTSLSALSLLSLQAHLEEDKTFVLLDDDDDDDDHEGEEKDGHFLEDDTETDVHDIAGY